MRTTIDVADELFKQIKLKAVNEGVPLKALVTRALEREVRAPANQLSARAERAKRLFAALDRARNQAPVGSLKREQLYDRPMLRRH